MREREVKAYFLKRAKEEGCIARKVRWEGRRDAPDWRLMRSPNNFASFHNCWVELKATGKVPSAAQLKEHQEMRRHGEAVYVADSRDTVDVLF